MNRFIVAGKRRLLPLLLYGLIWIIISEGDLTSWMIGLPCIALAAAISDRLFAMRIQKINIRQLPGFIIWFLWHSLRGGVDVAWRALQPSVQLSPGLFHYRMTLPQGQARLIMVNVVSLLPGTLSADIEGDVLVLHALDTTTDVIAETRNAEQRVSALYGFDKGVAYE